MTEPVHVVKYGDTAWDTWKKYNKEHPETKISWDDFKIWNKDVDINHLKPGDKLRLSQPQEVKTAATQATETNSVQNVTPATDSVFTQTTDTNPKTDTSDVKNTILTQAKYESDQPEEVKNIKTFIKDNEGKESSTYIAPEGNATIGYGHVLIKQPAFIKKIAKSTNDKKKRADSLKEALQESENKAALKQEIESNMQDAAKLTGIGNVSIEVGDDLKLSDAQMELLLNADLKKAYNAMEKSIGKANLDKRTANEKQVALDLFYNAGGKAPKFIKAFKEGDMAKAQEELDFFTAKDKDGNKTYLLGLIRRSYSRMLLINNNELTDASKTKLLNAYNKYCEQKGKPQAKSFEEIESTLKN